MIKSFEYNARSLEALLAELQFSKSVVTQIETVKKIKTLLVYFSESSTPTEERELGKTIKDSLICCLENIETNSWDKSALLSLFHMIRLEADDYDRLMKVLVNSSSHHFEFQLKLLRILYTWILPNMDSNQTRTLELLKRMGLLALYTKFSILPLELKEKLVYLELDYAHLASNYRSTFKPAFDQGIKNEKTSILIDEISTQDELIKTEKYIENWSVMAGVYKKIFEEKIFISILNLLPHISDPDVYQFFNKHLLFVKFILSSRHNDPSILSGIRSVMKSGLMDERLLFDLKFYDLLVELLYWSEISKFKDTKFQSSKNHKLNQESVRLGQFVSMTLASYLKMMEKSKDISGIAEKFNSRISEQNGLFFYLNHFSKIQMDEGEINKIKIQIESLKPYIPFFPDITYTIEFVEALLKKSGDLSPEEKVKSALILLNGDGFVKTRRLDLSVLFLEEIMPYIDSVDQPLREEMVDFLMKEVLLIRVDKFQKLRADRSYIHQIFLMLPFLDQTQNEERKKEIFNIRLKILEDLFNNIEDYRVLDSRKSTRWDSFGGELAQMIRKLLFQVADQVIAQPEKKAELLKFLDFNKQKLILDDHGLTLENVFKRLEQRLDE